MSLVQYNFLHLPERIEFTNTKMIMHETGYLTKKNGTWKHFYYLKDHVGSNRLVLDDQGGEVQINNFYPYGLTQAEPTPRTDQAEQPYKFGGKELDRDLGVDAYDFEARMYNPSWGTFMQPDPLAEKYYSVSPYAYCANNPVNRIDPTGMDWYWDTDNTRQFNPDLNEDNQADFLKKGQTYIGKTDAVKNKDGVVIENYRKDGSIMYSNEASGYQRMVSNSLKTGNEEMGVITDKGVLVVPNHKNSSGEVNLTDYGYSVKDGNVVDSKGTEYNTIATAHTHSSGSGPSLYTVDGWGDLGFAANRTPNKPVFVLQNDGKNTISVIQSASANGRLTLNFNQYTVQNITSGMPGVNVNSIQQGKSLRSFTKQYSNYLRSFYGK